MSLKFSCVAHLSNDFGGAVFFYSLTVQFFFEREVVVVGLLNHCCQCRTFGVPAFAKLGEEFADDFTAPRKAFLMKHQRTKRAKTNSLVVGVAVCSHFAGCNASILVFIKARSLRSLTCISPDIFSQE